MYKVYCFGHVSVGKIHRIAGSFPQANGYGEILETLQNFSGEALGSAVVLNRLGNSVKLTGNWLGDNPQGRLVLKFLSERGIDTSALKIKSEYDGVNEIVITDGKTRTVFGRYIDLLFSSQQWENPELDDIKEADLVCVDPSFGLATEFVIVNAHRLEKPVVSCDLPLSYPHIDKVHTVILSEEFLKREYPQVDLEDLMNQYLEKTQAWVVFTFGEKPYWYANGKLKRIKKGRPFMIDPLDTTGAGDSFRGGVIDGILRGLPMEESLQFAAALAAMVCLSTPGCCCSPSRAELDDFILMNQFLNEE